MNYLKRAKFIKSIIFCQLHKHLDKMKTETCILNECVILNNLRAEFSVHIQ